MTSESRLKRDQVDVLPWNMKHEMNCQVQQITTINHHDEFHQRDEVSCQFMAIWLSTLSKVEILLKT